MEFHKVHWAAGDRIVEVFHHFGVFSKDKRPPPIEVRRCNLELLGHVQLERAPTHPVLHVLLEPPFWRTAEDQPTPDTVVYATLLARPVTDGQRLWLAFQAEEPEVEKLRPCPCFEAMDGQRDG